MNSLTLSAYQVSAKELLHYIIQLGEFPQLYSETPTDSGREWEKLRWKSLSLLREALSPPFPHPIISQTQNKGNPLVFSPTSSGSYSWCEKLSVQQVRKISTNVERNMLGWSCELLFAINGILNRGYVSFTSPIFQLHQSGGGRGV